MASIALASSAVKNCQGPGRTASGADDGKGDQGIFPRIISARVKDVVPANQSAAEIRKWRRCSMTSSGGVLTNADLPTLFQPELHCWEN
jgi:hypothetical protein